MKKIIALSTILAGAIHASYVAIEHWSEFPPLETVFFVSAGLAQIVWALLFFRSPSEKKYYFGLLINGGILVTWLLTRIVSAPFQEGVEAIALIDSSIALLELIAIICSVGCLLKKKQGKILKTSAVAFFVVIFSGLANYSLSMGMEFVFPDRVFEHSHGHSESDGHMDEAMMGEDIMGEDMMGDDHFEDSMPMVENHIDDDHPHDLQSYPF